MLLARGYSSELFFQCSTSVEHIIKALGAVIAPAGVAGPNTACIQAEKFVWGQAADSEVRTSLLLSVVSNSLLLLFVPELARIAMRAHSTPPHTASQRGAAEEARGKP
jgi:hypothetical protein